MTRNKTLYPDHYFKYWRPFDFPANLQLRALDCRGHSNTESSGIYRLKFRLLEKKKNKKTMFCRGSPASMQESHDLEMKWLALKAAQDRPSDHDSLAHYH